MQWGDISSEIKLTEHIGHLQKRYRYQGTKLIRTTFANNRLSKYCVILDLKHSKSYLPKLQLSNGWWRWWLGKPWTEIWQLTLSCLHIKIGFSIYFFGSFCYYLTLDVFAGTWLSGNLTRLMWETQSLPHLHHCCCPKTLAPSFKTIYCGDHIVTWWPYDEIGEM